MSSGGDSATTSTTPWGGQQPYLSDVMSEAYGLYSTGGPSYYPGQTVAGFSDASQYALDATQQRAAYGSPTEQGFKNYLTSSMGQQNINPVAGAQAANQAAQGIGAGQNLTLNAGQGMDYGQAQQIAGQEVGSVADPNAFVQNTLGSSSPSFQGAYSDISSTTGLGNTGNVGTQFDVNTAAANQLQSTSEGDFLGSNPYLDATFNAGKDRLTDAYTEEVMPGIASQFGAAGRTGSGAHALSVGKASGEYTDSIANLAAQTYNPAYEAERDRQLSAAQAGGSLGLQADQMGSQAEQFNADFGQQGTVAGLNAAANVYGMDQGQQLSAAQLGGDLYNSQNSVDLARRSLSADLYNSGQDRSLAAGGQLTSAGLEGVSNLTDVYGAVDQSQFRAGSLAPNASTMDYQNLNALTGVGSAYDAYTQQLIDADAARWDYSQNQPYANLSNYANIVNGIPTFQNQTTPTGNSTVGNAAGGAMMGYQMSGGNPYGALIGGFAGAVM